MSRYIIKRMLSIIPVFLLATLFTTGMIHLSPVDPAEAYLAAHIQPTDEVLAQKRSEFGLDEPFYMQYLHTIEKVVRLDFGRSYMTNQPVLDEVIYRIPATIQLAFTSLLIAICVSIPLGFFSGLRKNGVVDHVSRMISFLGASIPTFVLGYLLIFFFQ